MLQNVNNMKGSILPNDTYGKFLAIFVVLYNKSFSELWRCGSKKIENFTLQIIKGIKKFSKRKQKLYDKFLKFQNDLIEEKWYKTYQKLFEWIKRTLHKIWSFPLRVSSVNTTKSAGNFFGNIYWRNLQWNFCAVESQRITIFGNILEFKNYIKKIWGVRI